jgi:hypothetical protein
LSGGTAARGVFNGTLYALQVNLGRYDSDLYVLLARGNLWRGRAAIDPEGFRPGDRTGGQGTKDKTEKKTARIHGCSPAADMFMEAKRTSTRE